MHLETDGWVHPVRLPLDKTALVVMVVQWILETSVSDGHPLVDITSQMHQCFASGTLPK